MLELNDFYNRDYDCSKRDKKICMFIKEGSLSDDEKNTIKIKYLSDPIKLIILKDFRLIEYLIKENEAQID